MKTMPNSTVLFVSLLTLALVGLPLHTQAAQFVVSITNLSPNVLSPAAFISHNAGFDLFDAGEYASFAVENLAESGDNSGIIGQAAASPFVQGAQVASGGILAPNQTGQAIIKADGEHPLLSFMTMMGISNDGFIGGTTGDGAIALFTGTMARYGTYVITPSMIWDAGTEVNDEALGSVGALGGGNGGIDEFGVITSNHPGILGIGGPDGIPAGRNWTGGDVARITVAPVPEPTTLLLLGVGLAGLALRRPRSTPRARG